jgi:hypothetical protein
MYPQGSLDMFDFEAVTTVVIFWDLLPCYLNSQRFQRNVLASSLGSHSKLSKLLCCLHGLLTSTEHGGSTSLENIGKILSDYMVSYPRR